MIIYPAIDISNGEIVRLVKGDFKKKTIYKKNLVNQVKDFQKNGAIWIHVVDLDGALLGKNKNQKSIKKVLDNSNCKIQLGGGIRTLENIKNWISLGVDRVIIGTAAILEENLVKEAINLFPNKISVGLDLFGDFVAIKGWTEVFKEKKCDYFFKKFSELGVESIIYTDIKNDGVLKGPNFKKILEFKKMVDVPLIASGGISNISDIKKLLNLGLEGVIVGKAIYDNKVSLKDIFSLEKNVKD